MTRPSGAVRIFHYNRPVYVGTWLAAAVLIALVPFVPAPLAWAAALAAGTAIAWSAVSLLVSHYVYDRSELASGKWIASLLGSRAESWASVHAGLDAEVELDGVLPGRCAARLDVFDPEVMGSPSVARARRRTPPSRAALRCTPTALPLADGSCDAIVVAFTAHEIRDRDARERFFGELFRALRPGGRVVLVEHLRDAANFLAFGPGCLHFLARGEWLRLAARARLAVAAETRISPWVTALALERRP